MSNRTTDQWKALLESTTAGPWKCEEHISHDYPAGPEWGPMLEELEHAVQDEKGEHLFGAYNNYKMIEHPGNLPLAASAPEAVAEVVRLRRELEELRDEMDRKARLSSAFGTSGYAEVSFRSSLTRILNGDPQ